MSLTILLFNSMSILLILLVLCHLLLFASLLFLWRNERVGAYRLNILDRLPMQEKKFQRAMKEYKRISYHEMLWKFWRPLRSFYDESLFK